MLRVSTIAAIAYLILPNQPLFAQYAPPKNDPSFTLTPPTFDSFDENGVSMLTGKLTFKLKLLEMGSLSYSEYHITAMDGHGLNDLNQGLVAACLGTAGTKGYGGSGECASDSIYRVIVAEYAGQRSLFEYKDNTFRPLMGSGGAFSVIGSYCVWTQRDGTKIFYNAYYDTIAPGVCQSRNVAKVVKPNGIILQYYYASTNSNSRNPILSITSNEGYMLKYVYPDENSIVTGNYTKVVAINRAFQACEPSAITCSIEGWPTATFATQDIDVSSNPDDLQGSSNPRKHHLVTLTDAQMRSHIFETDSLHRFVSYQPPGSEKPVYRYTMCSVGAKYDETEVSRPLRDCFGKTFYRLDTPVDTELMINTVSSVVISGIAASDDKIWTYGRFGSGPVGYPSYYKNVHYSVSPSGTVLSVEGNLTSGMERYKGPIDTISNRDGSILTFERSVLNPIKQITSAGGHITKFDYDSRLNLKETEQVSSTDSSLSYKTIASYASSCDNIVTCNKPTSIKDARLNETSYTYSEVHGGLITETKPAVNDVQPQRRFSYIQKSARYLNSAGIVVEDPNPIWMLASESYCRTGSFTAQGGCKTPSDEVVKTYQYGDGKGVETLIVRGVAITAAGVTLRTCYGHDKYGHPMWEQAANAKSTTCSAY